MSRYGPTIQPGNLTALQCGKCRKAMEIEQRNSDKGWNDWLCRPCGIRYRVRDAEVPYEFITTGVEQP